MKLKDIVTGAVSRQSKAIQPKKLARTDDAAGAELLMLLKADDAGLVTGCPTLAADELECLAGVLARLRVDGRYQPSPMLMQFVVDANTRVWTASGAAGV